MQQRKNFITNNTGFTCEACIAYTPPAKSTSRNHCMHCLASKHVDNIPGDRANPCHGIMPAIDIEGTDPEHLDIVHRCNKCKHIQKNRIAPDDNKEVVLDIIKNRSIDY